MYAYALIQHLSEGWLNLGAGGLVAVGVGCRKGHGTFAEGKYHMHEKAFPYTSKSKISLSRK